jgi:polyferredoxin
VGFAPTWQSNLFLYLLVGGLVSLALVFAKNFWCFWICPFVAMQETAHFIGGGRVRPITKRQIRLRNTRYFILWGVLLVVLLMRSPAISTFEPWGTIFSVEGTPEQWLLVIVTLGVAMFVYDFWCHYLCPVGATMDIILRVRMWFGDGLRRVFAR